MIEQGCLTLPGCDELCPYSAAGRPEHFPARACIWHAECGCDNGAECAGAIAELAVRWNVPFEEHKHDRQS